MRDLVLDNTDMVSGLAGITATGGRLNVARAIGTLAEICDKSGGKLEIFSITPNPATDEIRIDYNIPDLDPYELLIYDSAGRLLLKKEPDLIIPGNQSYDLQLDRFVPGVYHVTLRHRGDVVSKSLLVQ